MNQRQPAIRFYGFVAVLLQTTTYHSYLHLIYEHLHLMIGVLLRARAGTNEIHLFIKDLPDEEKFRKENPGM